MKNQLIFTGNTVIKLFHSKIAYRKEKELLSILAGFNISPQIISIKENQLEISLINGITLAEVIDKAENIFHIFRKFVEWITEFNSITENICLDDINLKNFIYSETEDKIYGIDYECWHYGDNKSNFGALLAIILAAKFANTDLQNNLYNHIKEYIVSTTDIDCDTLEKLIENETTKIHIRRKAMPFIRNSDCVIISGGKSSRMGSPKGLLEYNGFTFLDHIIYNTAVFDKQYISANDELYSSFGCDIIADNYKDIGPMGALQACLNKCEKEYVFFIPCDMPFITEETIFTLYNQLGSDADATVFKTDDKIFPTVGIYKKSVLPYIEAQIQTGSYKMMAILDRINTQYIQPTNQNQFKNINTPQDYKSI